METLSQSRSRSAFRAAAASLLALIALSAVLAGCGGAKEPAPVASETTTETPAPSTTEPAATLDPAADAKVQFASKCATCHGPDGHGDGPAAAALDPKPRNYHDKAYMATRTDAQLIEVITNGKGAMPKWGGILTEGQIVALVAHVRNLGTTP